MVRRRLRSRRRSNHVQRPGRLILQGHPHRHHGAHHGRRAHTGAERDLGQTTAHRGCRIPRRMAQAHGPPLRRLRNQPRGQARFRVGGQRRRREPGG